MKKNRSDILQIILIILVSGQLLFGVFGGDGEDRYVRNALRNIREDVHTVSDTLRQLHKNSTDYREMFNANQIELAILRKERKMLELAHRQQQTRDRRQLQELTAALEQEKKIHRRLIRRAKEFEK